MPQQTPQQTKSKEPQTKVVKNSNQLTISDNQTKDKKGAIKQPYEKNNKMLSKNQFGMNGKGWGEINTEKNLNQIKSQVKEKFKKQIEQQKQTQREKELKEAKIREFMQKKKQLLKKRKQDEALEELFCSNENKSKSNHSSDHGNNNDETNSMGWLYEEDENDDMIDINLERQQEENEGLPADQKKQNMEFERQNLIELRALKEK